MKESPIFILQGEERDWITQLLVKGTPETLVISSAYIPSEEDKEKSRTKFEDLTTDNKKKRIKQSVVRAIADIEKKYKQYVINRPEISPVDFKTYSEIGDLYDCSLLTVEVESEDVPNTIERGIIFTSGINTELLAERLMKGASCPKLIVLEEKIAESSSEINNEFSEFDLKADLDMKFILALADPAVDLIILDQSKLTEEDRKVYKRLGKSAKCKIKTIQAEPLNLSPEEKGKSKKRNFWGSRN